MTGEAIAANDRAAASAMRISLPGDFWGGLAAMLVAVPSSIAFGVVIFSAAAPALVSSGALAGMIGATVLGIVAPLISRNGGFITAPCAPAAAVMSGLAAQLAAQRDLRAERIILLVALTALFSALLQMLYGAVRAGRLIKYIPYQVVNGYLSGVAVIIAVAQIPQFLGVPGGAGLRPALMSPQLWRWPAIVVGAVAITAMVFGHRLTRVIPGTIVGLVSSVAAYFAIAIVRPEMRILEHNSLVIGPIRNVSSLLDLISTRASSLFTIGRADLMIILGPALTLSVLLSIDTLKTGVVLDALTRKRHESNRELIGQGVANLASFFAGGIPGAGTMGPTLVNVTSGGRTWWSGVLEGALVLAALIALGGAIAWVPIAALSGILLVVAWRMFDFTMFRLLLLPSARLDFFVIAAVVVVAEAVGLIQAAVVGIGLAILLFIRNQVRSSVILRKADLRVIPSKRRRTEEETRILDERGGDALVVQLKDDLFFGTTDQLFSDLEHDLAERRFILLDFRRVQSMDYTAARLIGQMRDRLRDRGGELLFSGMPSSLPTRHDITNYMGQLGLVGSTGGIRVFETRDSALEWIEEQILGSAGWIAGESKPPLPFDAFGLFRNLDAITVGVLRESMREVFVPAGSNVFAAGDGGDEIFFVRSGRVHILLPLEGGKRHHLATICRGDFFGEMAFLDQNARSAEAKAATETNLFVLSRKIFDGLASDDPLLASRVFERLALAIAQRLRATDAELRALEER
ncbi:MAG: SLC26A/SulP transporter family protein [Thermoanaerobaculia bacterium]